MRPAYTILLWIASVSFMLCPIAVYAQGEEAPSLRWRGFGLSYGLLSDTLPTLHKSNFAESRRVSQASNSLAGTQIFYKGIVKGFFGFGYGSQDYEDANIEDVSRFRIAADIDWNVTKKATLNLGLRQSISNGNEVSLGKSVRRARLQFDYRFLHNLFYTAFIDYSIAGFKNLAREDKVLSAGSALRYNINPEFAVSGDYDFIGQDSSALGPKYDDHQFTARVHTSF